MTSFSSFVFLFLHITILYASIPALAQTIPPAQFSSQAGSRPANMDPRSAGPSPAPSRASTPPFTYNMTEKLAPGVLIADVPRAAGLAKIYSEAELRAFRYEILQGAGGGGVGARGGEFVVDAATGLVRTNASVDRDVICSKMAVCVIGVDVAIVQPKQHFQVFKLRITILDTNDHSPSFLPPFLELLVSESAAVGTAFALPAAVDADSGPFDVEFYSLSCDCTQFELRLVGGDLWADSDNPTTINSESEAERVLKSGGVDALRDRGGAGKGGVEDGSGGRGRGLGNGASKQGVGVTGRVFNPGEPRLIVKEALDRETRALYTVVVTAHDGGGGGGDSSRRRSGALTVTVRVGDANDNAPVFSRGAYEARVREDFPPGGVVTRVEASDADEGVNAQITYSFASQTQSSSSGRLFFIDPRRGDVTLRIPLDYEGGAGGASHSLTVVATDQGPGGVPAYARLVVHVEDVNDNAPAIRVNALSVDGYGEVSEDAPAGTFVAHIAIDDPDGGEGGVVSCDLVPEPPGGSTGAFKLQPRAGSSGEYEVVTSRQLDRETADNYTVTVTCHDNGVPSLSNAVTVAIRVLDVNDHAPVFERNVYPVSIREDALVGSLLVWVKATDADLGLNALVLYQLCPSSAGFPSASTTARSDQSQNEEPTDRAAARIVINETTGAIIITSPFDYEFSTYVEFCVEASDSAPQGHQGPQGSRLTSTALVAVSVGDANDEPPRFAQQAYSFGTYENQPGGTEIGSVSASDLDSAPYNRFTFSIAAEVPPLGLFSIDPESGRISANQALDREHVAIHHFVVKATDSGESTLSSGVNVTVYVADRNDNAPLLEFPSPGNDSVEVSRFSPPGHVFARLLARDADIGVNSRLTYSSVVSGSQPPLFDVDSTTGAVSVSRRLDNADQSSANFPSAVPPPSRYELYIQVTDQGTPSKAAVGMLNIILTSAPVFLAPAPTGQTRGAGLANQVRLVQRASVIGGNVGWEYGHQTTLIVLGCITAFIVIALLIAIVCIKWRQTVQGKRALRYGPGRAGAAGGGEGEGLGPSYIDCPAVDEMVDLGQYDALMDVGSRTASFKRDTGLTASGKFKRLNHCPDIRRADPSACDEGDLKEGTKLHLLSIPPASTPLQTPLSSPLHAASPTPSDTPAQTPIRAPSSEQHCGSVQISPGIVVQTRECSQCPHAPTGAVDSDSSSGCSTDLSNSDNGRQLPPSPMNHSTAAPTCATPHIRCESAPHQGRGIQHGNRDVEPGAIHPCGAENISNVAYRSVSELEPPYLDAATRSRLHNENANCMPRGNHPGGAAGPRQLVNVCYPVNHPRCISFDGALLDNRVGNGNPSDTQKCNFSLPNRDPNGFNNGNDRHDYRARFTVHPGPCTCVNYDPQDPYDQMNSHVQATRQDNLNYNVHMPHDHWKCQIQGPRNLSNNPQRGLESDDQYASYDRIRSPGPNANYYSHHPTGPNNTNPTQKTTHPNLTHRPATNPSHPQQRQSANEDENVWLPLNNLSMGGGTTGGRPTPRDSPLPPPPPALLSDAHAARLDAAAAARRSPLLPRAKGAFAKVDNREAAAQREARSGGSEGGERGGATGRKRQSERSVERPAVPVRKTSLKKRDFVGIGQSKQ